VELQEAYGQITSRGAELVAVSTDDVPDAAEMAGLAEAEYPILADPGGAVTRSYGVYNLLGDKVATPAAFIISAQGNILWRHIGQTIADRPAVQDILVVLDSLDNK
jgi:peroxiredoxin